MTREQIDEMLTPKVLEYEPVRGQCVVKSNVPPPPLSYLDWLYFQACVSYVTVPADRIAWKSR